jgi:hypothetical protein
MLNNRQEKQYQYLNIDDLTPKLVTLVSRNEPFFLQMTVLLQITKRKFHMYCSAKDASGGSGMI